jgi:hypothetical protein
MSQGCLRASFCGVQLRTLMAVLFSHPSFPAQLSVELTSHRALSSHHWTVPCPRWMSPPASSWSEGPNVTLHLSCVHWANHHLSLPWTTLFPSCAGYHSSLCSGPSPTHLRHDGGIYSLLSLNQTSYFLICSISLFSFSGSHSQLKQPAYAGSAADISRHRTHSGTHGFPNGRAATGFIPTATGHCHNTA